VGIQMNSSKERKPRILLVEDDPLGRMAMEHLFERENLPFVLECAGTLAEALEVLKSDPPDLALLDQNLPDGTGLEVQARLGDIPCIFITGATRTAIAVEAMKAGASDFLVKESSLAHLDLLPSVIEQTLEVHRLKEEVRRHHEGLQELVEERTRELRESETRWRAVTESAPECVLFVDRDMVVRFMNRSTPWVAKEDLVGRRIDAVLPSEECSKRMDAFEEVFRTGEQLTFETTCPISGGGILHYELRLYPRVVDGEVLDLVVNLLDISERKQAETAVLESRAELRALAQHIEEIREEEKASLARELHDELGQSLTALHMDLITLRSQLPEEAMPARVRLGEMAGVTDDLVIELQNICGRLRPAILDVLGLPEAIEWQVGEFRKRSEVEFDLKMEVGDLILESKTATAAFRLVQESLVNVLRHADASRVRISLFREGGALVGEIRDDGRGVTPEELASPTSLGLVGMRERVIALAGDHLIEPLPEGGTLVRFRLPEDIG